jgi:hypothetical protein
MKVQREKILLLFFVGFFAFSGCEGSDTRESVDDTVEELAGKKHVDRMKGMERDIGRIQDRQADRLQGLDEDGGDENDGQ